MTNTLSGSQTDSASGPLEGVPSNTAVPMRSVKAERYTSVDFAKQEAEHLWKRVWQMACREIDVPNPGDYLEYEILDQSVLIVRQEDGSLRALMNACRHKGAPLACGTGNVEQFRCPYHAWTYGLDGSLKFILSPDEFPVGPRYSLVDIKVDTWGGFVFVTFDDSAPPLLEYLDLVVTELAPYKYEHMQVTSAATLKMPVNWKSTIDPLLEAYHTAGTHPQLLMTLNDVGSTYENYAVHSMMINPWMSASPRVGAVSNEAIFEDMVTQLEEVGFTAFAGRQLPEGEDVVEYWAKMTREIADSAGVDISALDNDHLTANIGWLVFPNLVLQTTGMEALVWRVRPGDEPGWCYLDQYMLSPVPAGTSPKQCKGEYYENWRDYECGLVLSQDYENLARLQKGMRQHGFEDMLVASYQERRVLHMQDTLDKFLEDRPWNEIIH